VRLFHTLYLSQLPPSSFLEGLSSEQFAELGSIRLFAFLLLLLLLARAGSLAFLSSGSPFLAICRDVFIYFVHFWGGVGCGWGRVGVFFFLSVFSDSVDFSYSKGSF